MVTTFRACTLAAAILFAFAATATNSAARAEIQDYEFQLIDASPKAGAAVIAVRLVNKPLRNFKRRGSLGAWLAIR